MRFYSIRYDRNASLEGIVVDFQLLGEVAGARGQPDLHTRVTGYELHLLCDVARLGHGGVRVDLHRAYEIIQT